LKFRNALTSWTDTRNAFGDRAKFTFALEENARDVTSIVGV